MLPWSLLISANIIIENSLILQLPSQPMDLLFLLVEIANEEGVLPTTLHPYMPTDIGALKRTWMQLRDERDSYREKFNKQEQKIQKLTKHLENEWILNDYVCTEKKRLWEH